MKKQLLQLAQQCSSGLESALALAEHITTADSLENRVSQLQQAQARDQVIVKTWEPVSLLCGIGFVLALLYFAVTEPQNTGAALLPYWPAWILAALFVLSVVGFVKSANAAERLRNHGYELAQAVPMATAEVHHGRGLCEKALDYVANGYEQVIAWRDLAIAERGQLYAFDVEIMRCINSVLDAEKEKALNDAANAEAFKLVHSIGREPGVA